MGPHGGDHGHRIYIGRRYDLGGIQGDLHIWVSLFCAAQCVRAPIRDYRKLAIVQTVKITSHARPPVPITDNTNADHNVFLLPANLKSTSDQYAPSEFNTASGVRNRILISIHR